MPLLFCLSLFYTTYHSHVIFAFRAENYKSEWKPARSNKAHNTQNLYTFTSLSLVFDFRLMDPKYTRMCAIDKCKSNDYLIYKQLD